MGLGYRGLHVNFYLYVQPGTVTETLLKLLLCFDSALVNLSAFVMAMKASVSDPAMGGLLVELHACLEIFKGRRINQMDFIWDIESFVYDRLCLCCWIGMMPKIAKFASEKDIKNLNCVSKDCRCEYD